MENMIRQIFCDEKQLRITVPKGIGFNVGDMVEIESINENEFKVIKVKIIKMG